LGLLTKLPPEDDFGIFLSSIFDLSAGNLKALYKSVIIIIINVTLITPLKGQFMAVVLLS